MLLNTFLLQEQYSVVFLGLQLARQEESWEHCVLCVAGKCKNSAGSAECKDCVAGKYSTVVGAGSDLCQACPVNSVSMEGRDEFVDCQCNSGSTGANRGSCVLSRCIARKYKTNTGGAECTNCVAGKWSTAVGLGAASDVCQACLLNSVSAIASDEIMDCRCIVGWTGTGGGAPCSACIAGKYKSSIS